MPFLNKSTLDLDLIILQGITEIKQKPKNRDKRKKFEGKSLWISHASNQLDRVQEGDNH